ncbi:MAG: cupin domain-containing protein [Terriglobales bacterium]
MSRSVSSTSPADRNGQANWLQTRPGEYCLIRVPAADTNGAYSFVEIVSEPGDGTPLHAHQNEDEHLFVLEGTGRFAIGDKIFDAEAGTMVRLPRNIPHAWGNRSNSRLRIAVIVYPGGVEGVMPIIAAGGNIDLRALAAQYGVIVLGPTPF